MPKRAMDVMQGEVNRVLQLCDSSIVPITWQVPRKSYRDYHADIFPETNGYDAMMGPDQWSRGDNTPVPKINLDPKKRPKDVLTVHHKDPFAKARKRDFADNLSSRKSSISSSDKSMSSPSSEKNSPEKAGSGGGGVRGQSFDGVSKQEMVTYVFLSIELASSVLSLFLCVH